LDWLSLYVQPRQEQNAIFRLIVLNLVTNVIIYNKYTTHGLAATAGSCAHGILRDHQMRAQYEEETDNLFFADDSSPSAREQ
jgi:hypothetical protein